MTPEQVKGKSNDITLKEWRANIFESADQRSKSIREGYQFLFNMVLELPTLESQPSKFWQDYLEDEIEFVNIDPFDSSLSSNDRGLLTQVQKVIGSWPSLRFGVFDVKDDKKDNHKGVYDHSARIVVESPYGDIFRRKVVLNFSYRHSTINLDWYEKSFGYNLFGLSNEEQQRVNQASELQLLIAANSIIQLYSDRVGLDEE